MKERIKNYMVTHKYPILSVVCDSIRFDILNELSTRNLSYLEIFRQIYPKTDTSKRSNMISFHMRMLKGLHLVDKKQSNHLYFITVKGLRALKGAKMVNEAELFL